MASKWVSLLLDGQGMRVYLAQPETAGRVPGGLVIVETFDVNRHIQAVTDKPARQGSVALAPVLYHRPRSNPLFSYTADEAEARTMNVPCPVLGNFGVLDRNPTPGEVRRIEAEPRNTRHSLRSRNLPRRQSWLRL